MQHEVDPLAHGFARRRVRDRSLDQLDRAQEFGQVLPTPGRKIIENADARPFRDQGFHEVRADEAGATGDQVTSRGDDRKRGSPRLGGWSGCRRHASEVRMRSDVSMRPRSASVRGQRPSPRVLRLHQIPEVRNRLLQALLERRRRLPAQDLSGHRNVGAAHLGIVRGERQRLDARA